jgi:hypothetical protein
MGWKSVWQGTKSTETPPCAREKPRADWKKDLQTCCEGRKSKKRPTLVVGKKPNGKSQLTTVERQSNSEKAMWDMMQELLAGRTRLV